MLLGEVPASPQDVHFRLFGIPCRIHPLFWVASLLFTYPGGHGRPGSEVMTLMITGVLCLLVSVLVHEMGHALVMRWAGCRPSIVLYALGGYAEYGHQKRLRPLIDIVISFAGPLAGFLLCGLSFAMLIVVTIAYHDELPPLVSLALGELIFINLVLNVVNLLPVYPLDGGKIARTFLQAIWGHMGVRASLVLSIVVSGLAAIFFARSGGMLSFPVLFFGLLCIENYQALQGQPGVRL